VPIFCAGERLRECVAPVKPNWPRHGFERPVGAVSNRGIHVKARFDAELRRPASWTASGMYQAIKAFLAQAADGLGGSREGVNAQDESQHPLATYPGSHAMQGREEGRPCRSGGAEQPGPCVARDDVTPGRGSRLIAHSNCATVSFMKTAQLPPVRVEQSVRDEIESVLRQGETLSQFVERATVQAAQRRKSQDEFLARGRASLKRAQKSGEYYSAKDALDAMQARLDARISQLGKERRKAAADS